MDMHINVVLNDEVHEILLLMALNNDSKFELTGYMNSVTKQTNTT